MTAESQDRDIVETRMVQAHPKVMQSAGAPLTTMISHLPGSFTGAQVVEDIDILAGTPIVAGSRIPAATILAYLRDGYSRPEIEKDYPTLPDGGIEAVKAWAERRFGPHWQSRVPPRS